MRKAGLLLILSAAATIVAVVGRVSADADRPTPAASLAAIAETRGLYGLGGAGRFASGAALAAAGWFLFNLRNGVGRRGSPAVPLLFLVSGTFTACSGASAVALAGTVPEGIDAATVAHMVTGPLFVIWLAAAGSMLLAGRTWLSE